MRFCLRALDRFLDACIPRSVRKESEEKHRRARFVLIACLLLAFWGAIFSPFNYLMGAPLWLIISPAVSGLLLAIAAPILVRKTGSGVLAGNLAIFLLFILQLFHMVFGEGLLWPAALWVVFLPLGAIVFAGARSGLIWVVISIFILVFLAWAEQTGIPFTQRKLDPTLGRIYFTISLVSLVVALTTLLNLYEREKSKLNKILLARTRELEALNQFILLQQEKMMNSAKMSALGEMAGGVAHEINTPLTIIEMNAHHLEILVQQLPLNVTYITKRCEVISSTVKRIARIVSALLTFSKEGGVDSYQKSRVSKIIEESLILCQEKFKTHGIQIQCPTVPEDLVIECEPILLSQVLISLLNNSHDAVLGLAEKWISIDVKEIQMEEGVEGVEISVSDSGRGIPPELHEKLFQPFFTTKQNHGGTGLGLSVSMGIIQKHCGTIRIDTQSKNTRFVIQVPKLGLLISRPIGN